MLVGDCAVCLGVSPSLLKVRGHYDYFRFSHKYIYQSIVILSFFFELIYLQFSFARQERS